MRITGKQFVIVAGQGTIEYSDTMEAAQQIAERLAHSTQGDVYVLSPVLRVAPKRDVTSTPIKL